MVMMTAPDPAATGAFYVEHLGFRVAEQHDDEVIVEGYGMQIVFTRGEGGGHAQSPDPADAAIEIPATMARVETIWDRDRERDPGVIGPMLDPSGAFVYVTLDPARNAVALVSPLPSEREEPPIERVTQRLKRPEF